MRTALAVVGGLVWGFALYVLDAHAGDPVVRVNPQQALVVDMYVRTRSCMRSAGTAAHERGDNAKRVRYFMASVCGTAFTSFLSRDMKEEQAQEIIVRMTRTAYYEDVLGVTEPPVTTKTP